MLKTLPKIKQHPLLQTFKTIFYPLQVLEENQHKYGDIFIGQAMGFPETVVISNPQAIQQIFTAEPKKFKSGPANKILAPLFGPYSMILQDGEYHQQQRKLLTPAFHGERMKSYGELIKNITTEIFDQLPSGKEFIARSLMQEISLTIILQTIFGITSGEKYHQLKNLVINWLEITSSPKNSSFIFLKILQKDLGAGSPWGRFLRNKAKIYEFLYREIQEKRVKNDLQAEDILTLMLSAKDEEGKGMSDEELADELMTLLFAGHETTATALAWCLYWIHHLPEVKNQLLQELGNLGENPSFNDIIKLPYFNAVCSETLRIYPVALFTFPRILQEDMTIMGYELPAKTVLSICIYLVHHHQTIYPQPEKFQPERFIEKQYTPYEFFPFGGGNRKCLGMAFANFEMKLVLATILQKYQLQLGDNRNLKPSRRGVTLAPSNGVKMIKL